MDYKSQIAKGPFSGTIESLSQYECLGWFIVAQKPDGTIDDENRYALKQIETVEAAGQTVEFVQKDGALNIMLPEELPQDMPVCIKAKLK